METYHSFRPGQPWKDTEGKLIQTHGGSVLYHEGTYYWYGENKNGATSIAPQAISGWILSAFPATPHRTA